MPDLNEKNYILLGGMKIEIEKFLSVNLNQSLQKISYHVLCILPDTLIGQWVREKIFFLDPYVSGSHGILDINILEQRGCNYLYERYFCYVLRIPMTLADIRHRFFLH